MTRSGSIAFDVEHHGEIAVIAVRGEVDMVTAPPLQRAIDDLIGQGHTTLVLDLSEVTFMASAGLTIIASTSERLGDAGGFAVVASDPATVRPIQLTHLDQLVSPCPTLNEAMTRVRNGRHRDGV